MATVLVKNADRMMLTAVPLDEGIELAFADGCTGLIPFRDLPEILSGGGVAGLELPNPYEIVVMMAGGDRTEIPWDFARHYCDRSYRPRVEAVARQGRSIMARRIREQRVRTSLSLVELAQRSSVETDILARIESGVHSPRLDTLSDIAHALGLTLEDLLNTS